MAQAVETPQKMQGGRGLLLMWRRELERKVHINRYLPGQSRGATIEIMAQMDRHPGHRQETANETTYDYDNGDTESTRTWYHQMNPQPEETPSVITYHMAKMFGKGCPHLQFPTSFAYPILHFFWLIGTFLLRMPGWTWVRVWGFNLLFPVFRHWLIQWTLILNYDPDSFLLLSFLSFHCIFSLGQDIDYYYLFVPFHRHFTWWYVVVSSM